MDSPQMIFVAIDGDGIGQQVGRAVLADDVQGLHEISGRIDHVQEIVNAWLQSVGGQRISGGGDEATMTVPAEAVDSIEQLRKDVEHHLGFTISVGVGASLSQAGTSLLVAKFRGKDQVAIYDDSVKSEIEAAKQRVAEGTASDEERKISAAYLEPKEDASMQNKSEHDDCEYCKEVDGNEDLAHCQYCHDAETAEGEDDCQYCKESDSEGADHEHTGDDCQYCQEAEADAQDEHTHEDGSEADCPYCQDAAAQGAAAAGEQNGDEADDSQDFAGAGVNKPAIDKPDGSQPPDGLGVTNDEMPNPSNEALDAVPPEGADALPPDDESIYDKDEHSKDAMQAIVAGLDDGAAVPGAEMNQIDSADMPVNDAMEDNVSRPEGYDSNNPSDMGLAEEEVPDDGPDLSGVLQEGLDSHADNIQKEKIIQMVGEALEGFKASKDVLERAKEQAPQLYQASIAMLRAMIEMAGMLGLSEDVEQEAPGAQEEIESAGAEESPEGRPESRDPAHFAKPEEKAPAEGAEERPEQKPPAHFAKPAASKEDAAPEKKSQGQLAKQ